MMYYEYSYNGNRYFSFSSNAGLRLDWTKIDQLTIYENVRVNDKRGNLIADKLLFDITKQKLNITSFNDGKINANVKLNEKRF